MEEINEDVYVSYQGADTYLRGKSLVNFINTYDVLMIFLVNGG